MDEKWNLKTIPLMIGNERAMKLAMILVNSVSVLAIFHFLSTETVEFGTLVAIIFSNLWATFILYKFRENNSALYNAFLVEGTLVVQFALITIAAVISSLF